jgi:hypothetical protein
MRKTLSILDRKNREFDVEILKAIAGKYNLSEDFVLAATNLLDKDDRSLITKSIKEIAPLITILIIGLWGSVYCIVPEIFQAQSDPLITFFGYFVLISGSTILVWTCIKERIPTVERGSFEEEVEFAEKLLKPMIDDFLSD